MELSLTIPFLLKVELLIPHLYAHSSSGNSMIALNRYLPTEMTVSLTHRFLISKQPPILNLMITVES